MLDDEQLAFYGTISKLVRSMEAREMALEERTAQLDASIAEMKKVPSQLASLITRSIGATILNAIQKDLASPVAGAVNGSIESIRNAADEAKGVMRQVGKAARFQTLGWIATLLLSGAFVGSSCSYWLFVRNLGKINGRLDTIQQQLTPAPSTPNSDSVPPPLKKKHGAH